MRGEERRGEARRGEERREEKREREAKTGKGNRAEERGRVGWSMIGE